MDILYIIGTGSKWSNNELRFSLRSVAKFGQNVGRIFVCGANPGILSDEVIFVPCDDPYDMPHKNIMHKIQHVIDTTNIGEEFLLSSDDHFFVRPVDFDNYPLYHKGEIPSVAQKKENYYYSMVETRQLLEEAGLPVYLTNPHCDTHFSRSVWQKTAALRVAAMNLPHGGEVNCIIGNQMIADGVKPTLYRDVKIIHFDNIKDLEQQIGDSHCFSIFDSAIRCGLENYLLRLFPEPCRYEYMPTTKKDNKQPRRIEYTVRKGGSIITKTKYVYD